MMIGNDVQAVDEQIWTSMIQEADINHDGEIDYDEFTKMMYNFKDSAPLAAKPAPRK